MAPRPGGSEGGHEEIVQFGRPRRPLRGWPLLVVLACVVAATVFVVVSRTAGTSRPAPQAVPSLQAPSVQQYPPVPRLAPSALATLPPPVVTQTTRPLLGITASWELFGLTSDGTQMVAVRFAAGQITRTALPGLASTGPVAFVPGPGQVVIRPFDYVPGYVVPDGQRPRQLTGILAAGGILVPGPELADDWFLTGDTGSIVQVAPGGAVTGVRLPSIPQQWPQIASADGRGGLLVSDNSGGLYDVGPGLYRPIPVAADVIAVGPTRWLGMRCVDLSCQYLAIDPVSGTTRALGGQVTSQTGLAEGQRVPGGVSEGAVAPDGAIAAVAVSDQRPGGFAAHVELISLLSGAVTAVPVTVGQGVFGTVMAWSPDSRWLFVVTATGGIAAIDPTTGRAQQLRLPVGGISQIALRPG